ADGKQLPLKIFHHWCALKKDEGPCKALIDRFYYNIETQRCELFEYGGCQGNENNFETEEQCEVMCVVKAKKSPCHLEDEPGPCRGIVPRYFFDSKVNECRRFFYGGCFGNANNFRTLKECQDRCQPMLLIAVKIKEKDTDIIVISDSKSYFIPFNFNHNLPQSAQGIKSDIVPPQHCMIPPEQGKCGDLERRFFYNSKTKRCHAFRYSGCGGNMNNFTQKKMCMRTCMKGKSQRTGRIRIKTKNANILFRSI
ncbi:tissue factor pathway inhibitor isoform 1 precursor, partial [Silurus asotus]